MQGALNVVSTASAYFETVISDARELNDFGLYQSTTTTSSPSMNPL
jgi:hypothetical protein